MRIILTSSRNLVSRHMIPAMKRFLWKPSYKWSDNHETPFYHRICCGWNAYRCLISNKSAGASKKMVAFKRNIYRLWIKLDQCANPHTLTTHNEHAPKRDKAQQRADDIKDYVDAGHCESLPLCMFACLYHRWHNFHLYPVRLYLQCEQKHGQVFHIQASSNRI